MATIKATGAKKDSDAKSAAASKAVAAAKKLAVEISNLARKVGNHMQDIVKQAKEEVGRAAEALAKAKNEEKFANSIAADHLQGAASSHVKTSAAEAVAKAQKRSDDAKKALASAEGKLK